MDGTFRHVLLPPDRLPYGPVSICISPTLQIRVLLDETLVDPILLPEMDRVGAQLAAAIQPLARPLETPQILAHIRAVPDVGAGRLINIEFDGLTINGFIDKSLIKSDILRPYGQHATQMLRRFTLPVL